MSHGEGGGEKFTEVSADFTYKRALSNILLCHNTSLNCRLQTYIFIFFKVTQFLSIWDFKIWQLSFGCHSIWRVSHEADGLHNSHFNFYMRQSFHNFNTFWLRFHQQLIRFEILSNILSVRWLKLVFYCVSLRVWNFIPVCLST